MIDTAGNEVKRLSMNVPGRAVVLFVLSAAVFAGNATALESNFSPKSANGEQKTVSAPDVAGNSAAGTAAAGPAARAETSDPAAGTGSTAPVKQIEAKAVEAKQEIKHTQVEVEKAKLEAEKAVKEKERISKETQVKEQAADAAKKEAEILQKEAQATNDTGAAKKAQELKQEAVKLEKEAEIHKEKLGLAEVKAQVAQTTVEANQARIEELRQELLKIQKERSVLRNIWDKAASAAVVVFSGLLLFLLMKLGIRRLESLVTEKEAIRESEQTLRVKTMIQLFNWIGSLVIIMLVIYSALKEFDIDLTPLIAGAGIMGLAFGFGGQYLIRDLINGVFILLEGQYRVNDVVKIGEYGGLVEGINLRITTLRDLEGRVIIVPNGEIKTVVNFTREFSQALLDIGVAYKENVDRVMEVMKEVAAGMRKDPYFRRLILGDLEMLGVDSFDSSQVTIKCRIKTLPIKQWEVAREFRRRLKNRFDELGIEIPFPHTTLYMGTGKENDWLRQFAEKTVVRAKGGK